MSTTLHPTAVVRGWAEGRLLPPRRIRRGHAGRLAPHFANVRPAKFVFSSGGGMGLREGAPEETHRDSHQPPVPSAVYNPHQGPPEGDDDVPNLFNNVVNNERGGRIRARASKWDSLRDELGGQAKTSFGMSLGDPLGKNGAHGSRSATEATRGDGETSDDDPPPATGKAPEPAEELEELLMSKMRTTRPTGEAPASNSAKPASEKTQFSKTNEDAAKKKKGDKFSAAVEIKAKKREEKDKLRRRRTRRTMSRNRRRTRGCSRTTRRTGADPSSNPPRFYFCARRAASKPRRRTPPAANSLDVLPETLHQEESTHAAQWRWRHRHPLLPRDHPRRPWLSLDGPPTELSSERWRRRRFCAEPARATTWYPS